MSAVITPRTEALRSVPLDSWIALAQDESRIIATGATYEEVVAKSDEAGVQGPLIVKTPESWLSFSV